jgi:hypothetical protein
VFGVADREGWVKVWNLAENREVTRLGGPTNAQRMLGFIPGTNSSLPMATPSSPSTSNSHFGDRRERAARM